MAQAELVMKMEDPWHLPDWSWESSKYILQVPGGTVPPGVDVGAAGAVVLEVAGLFAIPEVELLMGRAVLEVIGTKVEVTVAKVLELIGRTLEDTTGS